MSVPVQHEIGAVLGDRGRQPVAAEHHVDALRLAFDSRLNRRVVQQDDPQVAVHDLLQPLPDRGRVVGGLRIHLAQQRLAEVRQCRAGKAADEAFRPDDAELELADHARAMRPLEHVHARLLDDRAQLIRTSRVKVVVPEHSEDRNLEMPACICHDLRLLGLAGRREVARKQDHVRLAGDGLERTLDALPCRLGCVEVAGCSYADHRCRCCTFRPNGNGKLVPESSFDELIDAMKAAAAILQQTEIPFVLGGGLSAWARGGPKSEHDVDFLLRPEDADLALTSFEEAGWRTERPPEGWLYKAWHENDALVDLIFNPASGPITDEIIERAPVAEVMALRINVSTLEDVRTAKLMAITEQEPDFGAVLEWARALREQIDWDTVRRRTEASPFAKAFFTLVEGLGIVDPEAVSAG
jgi:Nucleotidyl transferase of unknown function (DUF2204)